MTPYQVGPTMLALRDAMAQDALANGESGVVALSVDGAASAPRVVTLRSCEVLRGAEQYAPEALRSYRHYTDLEAGEV